MDRIYVIEAGEIPWIEGEDALYAVEMHGGNQPCIVDLDSGDAVVHQQPSPFVMDRKTVGEQSNSRFDGVSAPIGLCWSLAISIAIGRPGEDIPELTEVLRGVTWFGPGKQQAIHGGGHEDFIG